MTDVAAPSDTLQTAPPHDVRQKGFPGMTTFKHSAYMTVRYGRGLLRQPYFVAISLVQPVIWLFLFGGLFKRVIEIPGFGSDSYLVFLTPGIVTMTALFAGGWLGMGVIEDLDLGVTNRFLVSPARRGSLIAGLLGYQAVLTVIQTLIVFGLAMAGGARFPGGAVGLLLLIVVAVLLGTIMGGLSCALALVIRKRESVIAAVQFLVMPLTFLSGSFLAINLAPGWIQNIAKYNPVNWAVEAGRGVLGTSSPDWGMVFSRIGFLALLMVAFAWLAVRAFRSYQRSV